jgi:outer membrane protein TolC
MRRFVLLILAAAWSAGAQGQVRGSEQTQGPGPGQVQATIEDCYEWSRANYPLAEQYGLIDRASEYSLSNAARGWLPQVGFSASASYQSDVTSLPLDPALQQMLGGRIPTLSRDQYGARVEIAQPVWDGGAVGAARAGVRAAAEVERASIEVSLYALRQRVNALYFGILLTGERLDRLGVLERDLGVNVSRLEAALRGGLAHLADVDAVRVEILRAAQQRAALEATRGAYITMLAALTGRPLDSSTRFEEPSPEAFADAAGEIRRPELGLFEAQMRTIEARQKSLDAAITPRLGLFASGGYGKPGLNMLANRFEWWGVVGARLSWNIGGLYTRRNDMRRLATDLRGVELRRDAFLLNTSLDAALTGGEIGRLREQLRHDEGIVALRESVLRASEAKLEGGTISGSDLARDINALDAARQDELLHRMELLAALYNLKFTTNN